jgi:bifunctional DNase/RNase
MNLTQLIYKGIAEIVGSESLAVITLADLSETHAISVICDSTMRYQLEIRERKELCARLFPEVMFNMLKDVIPVNSLRILIDGIDDGEYKTSIICLENDNSYPIRLSDAILLSQIGNIPIFIDSALMLKQSSVYQANTDKLSIPINALSIEKLKDALDKAIREENYRLASIIKQELSNRKDK